MECREEQHDIQCTMKENGRMGVGRAEVDGCREEDGSVFAEER